VAVPAPEQVGRVVLNVPRTCESSEEAAR
jgi:hypothetical protein